MLKKVTVAALMLLVSIPVLAVKNDNEQVNLIEIYKRIGQNYPKDKNLFGLLLDNSMVKQRCQNVLEDSVDTEPCKKINMMFSGMVDLCREVPEELSREESFIVALMIANAHVQIKNDAKEILAGESKEIVRQETQSLFDAFEKLVD